MNPMMMGNQINPKVIDYATITLIMENEHNHTIKETVDLNSKINSFLTKIQDKYSFRKENCIMTFKGRRINLNLTFAENGISNGSIISLKKRDLMMGGEVGSCAKSIADPTKKAPVEWPTTKDGPFYLAVENGINIFGFCQNNNCQAYEKEVCSPFGFGTFDLIDDLTRKSKKCPKCPACENVLLEVESCGFMNCEYSYIGKKYENKKLIDVNFRKKTKGGNKTLDYIDPGKKGENKSTWVELRITAEKLNNN